MKRKRESVHESSLNPLTETHIQKSLPGQCVDLKRIVNPTKAHTWMLPEWEPMDRRASHPTHPICDGKDCAYELSVPHLRLKDAQEEKEWKRYVDAQVACGERRLCPAVYDAWICPSEKTGGFIRDHKNIAEFPFHTLERVLSAWKLVWLRLLERIHEAHARNFLVLGSSWRSPVIPLDEAFVAQSQMDQNPTFRGFLEQHFWSQRLEPLFVDVYGQYKRLRSHKERRNDLQAASDSFVQHASRSLRGRMLDQLKDFVRITTEESASTLDLRTVFAREYKEWMHDQEKKKGEKKAHIVYLPIRYIPIDRASVPVHPMEAALVKNPDLLFHPDFLKRKITHLDELDHIYYVGLMAILMRETCMLLYLKMMHSQDLQHQSIPEILTTTLTEDALSENALLFRDPIGWLPYSSEAAQSALREIFSSVTPEKKEAFRHDKQLEKVFNSVIHVRGEDYPRYLGEGYRIMKPHLTAVVVVNSKNEYVGHVYTWDTKDENHECSMMGIRSSVRNILENYFDQKQGIRDIAKLLAEGVRRRCSLQCAQVGSPACLLKVVGPFGAMPAKLRKMGFRPSPYRETPEKKIEPLGGMGAHNYLYNVYEQGFLE